MLQSFDEKLKSLRANSKLQASKSARVLSKCQQIQTLRNLQFTIKLQKLEINKFNVS